MVFRVDMEEIIYNEFKKELKEERKILSFNDFKLAKQLRETLTPEQDLIFTNLLLAIDSQKFWDEKLVVSFVLKFVRSFLR